MEQRDRTTSSAKSRKIVIQPHDSVNEVRRRRIRAYTRITRTRSAPNSIHIRSIHIRLHPRATHAATASRAACRHERVRGTPTHSILARTGEIRGHRERHIGRTSRARVNAVARDATRCEPQIRTVAGASRGRRVRTYGTYCMKYIQCYVCYNHARRRARAENTRMCETSKFITAARPPGAHRTRRFVSPLRGAPSTRSRARCRAARAVRARADASRCTRAFVPQM